MRLPFLAVLGSILFAISPLISVLIAGAIAEWAGCKLNEAEAHRCVVCGKDIGRNLYQMYVLGWAALLTLPIGFVLFLVSVAWLVADTATLVAQRLRPSPAEPRAMVDVATSPPVRSHKLGIAAACLHISAVVIACVGYAVIALSMDEKQWLFRAVSVICSLVVCILLIGGLEFVAYGLHRRKPWARRAGLCLFGLLSISLLCPLGVLGLWALLDSGSKAEFGVA